MKLLAFNYSPELEREIESKGNELKKLAVKNAKHLAGKNQPALDAESLQPFIGEIKSGFEELAAKTRLRLRPEVHIADGKIDLDQAKQKEADIDKKIEDLKEENRKAEYELDGVTTQGVVPRWVVLVTLLLLIGETFLNARAFQVTGEFLLMSLVIAAALSIAVLIFGHLVPILYKSVEGKWRKLLVLGCSIVAVTALFWVLAEFRMKYFERHTGALNHQGTNNQSISPTDFVIINLFFFAVTALVSYLASPTYKEMKEKRSRVKECRKIHVRLKVIEKLIREKEALRKETAEKVKQHILVSQTAAYSIAHIIKLYAEVIESFKGTNVIYRSDRKIPECFNSPIPELEVESVMLYQTLN